MLRTDFLEKSYASNNETQLHISCTNNVKNHNVIDYKRDCYY
jgi:hypothetical protein